MVLDKYLSQRDGRLAQLDEIAQLAAEVLGATILFSCVSSDSISLMGYGTNDPGDGTPWDSLVKAAPAQISTCRHSILGHDETPLVLRNNDWRVAKNPLFTSGGGNVELSVSCRIVLPSVTQQGVVLPVGNICVFRYDEQSPWGDKENKILASLSKRISNEIVAIHDRETIAPRRSLQAELVGGFIYEDLSAAAPSPTLSLDSSPHSQPSVAMSAILGLQNLSISGSSDQPGRPYDDTVRDTARLVDASFAALLDVRELHRAPQRFDCVHRGLHRRDSVGNCTAQMAGQAANWHEQAGGMAVIGLHAVEEQDHDNLEAVLTTDANLAAIQAAVLAGPVGLGQLEDAMVCLVPKLARSQLVVPVFGHDGLELVLLVSDERRQAFDPADRAFVEQMATLCLAALTKHRLAQTTRSNVAFIAKISHELRTPMHGLAGQFHLLREVYTDAGRTGDELANVGPLLKEAEDCFSGLQALVDDAIAFARLGKNEEEKVEREGEVMGGGN